MPSDFVVRRDLQLVVTRFRGHVTAAEYTGLYQALLSHPDFQPGMTEVSDLRSVTNFDISSAAFTKVAAMTKRKLTSSNAHSRTMIVAPRTLPFGLSRMYEGMAAGGPQEVRVFRQLEGAAGHLGLTADELDGLLGDPEGFEATRDTGV